MEELDNANTSRYEEEPLVFETSDVESIVNLPVSEIEEPDVVVSRLDMELAREKFTFNVVDRSSKWDFLDSVELPLGGSGYETEVIKETKALKLARIARELEEIESDNQNGEDMDRDTIEELNSRLKKLLKSQNDSKTHTSDVNDTLHRVTEAIEMPIPVGSVEDIPKGLNNTNKFSAGPSTGPTTGPSDGTGKMLEVESKITKLETRIGSGMHSIPAQLDDLTRKIDIVYNPEHHTEQLKSKLLELNKHMETYLAQKRLEQLSGSLKEDTMSPRPTVSSEAKIEEIYSMLEHFSQFQDVLPRLLGRLRSLYEVHGEISGTVGTIKLVNVTIDSVQQEVSRWDRAVNELNSGLIEREGQFQSNKRSVEEAIDSLECRIKELEAKTCK